MAGVMGGESTEITASTTTVVIEAAYWEPTVIARTARRHRLPSEASRRFERAVDPWVAVVAAEAAAELLVRYGGGAIVGRSDVAGNPLPQQRHRVAARRTGAAHRPAVRAGGHRPPAAAGRLLGHRRHRHGTLTVVPPSWRPDLTRPADLVEEVARLEGFDTIPSVLPQAPAGTGLTAGQRRERLIAADLASAGLTEVLSFPFIGDRRARRARTARRRRPPHARCRWPTRWTPTAR